jgi:excisionase family DNA binding protein
MEGKERNANAISGQAAFGVAGSSISIISNIAFRELTSYVWPLNVEMIMPLDGSLSERLPTHEEAEDAKKAAIFFARHLTKQGGLALRIKHGTDGVSVELPPAVTRLVLDLLLFVSKGEAVTIVPFGAELSTQEAADLLNVSRPFLVKLIEHKEIPHHKVGTHRRVRAEDLFAYKRRRDSKRNDALNRLAELGQEIDAG